MTGQNALQSQLCKLRFEHKRRQRTIMRIIMQIYAQINKRKQQQHREEKKRNKNNNKLLIKYAAWNTPGIVDLSCRLAWRSVALMAFCDVLAVLCYVLYVYLTDLIWILLFPPLDCGMQTRMTLSLLSSLFLLLYICKYTDTCQWQHHRNYNIISDAHTHTARTDDRAEERLRYKKKKHWNKDI